MDNLNPEKGFLLIAEPSILGDVSFNRSVILLADYTPEGSVGFILNKPLDYTIQDLIPEINASFRISCVSLKIGYNPSLSHTLLAI